MARILNHEGWIAAPRDSCRDQGRRHLQGFPLVRISRLSVMPVTEKEWSEIEKMAGG
ncbi:MAG TPA: EVE domain-containing protein [Thermoanaerobaculia bacterium]